MSNRRSIRSAVVLPAHYDGKQVVLDAPYDLELNTPLVVTVLSAQDDEERADWLRFSTQNFAAGYGEDEPEYSLDNIKEWSPEYEGR